MKGKSTYTIALLIPDIDNPIYAQYMKYIEEYGQKLGFSIVMCSTGNDREREEKHLTLLRQKSVDGFIIASLFKNETTLKQLIKEKVPLVFFNNPKIEYSIDSVIVDDYLGGYQVGEHLLSLGHKKIGVIAEEHTSSEERIRGYRQACADKGVSVDDRLIVTCDSTLEGAQIQAEKLLSKEEKPTAIFGCNDVLAIGTMQAAKAQGILIPTELSIIGFDNTMMSRIVDPPLSTVTMPLDELAKQAMDILVQKIEKNNKITQRISMIPDLVIRQTTAPVNKAVQTNFIK
ncbi:LacI family DNA-binding transcriptional regulator [Bacillus taeanensis]|nr:substrate-binding domain-containing protein [Bacillus taeanensis]